MQFVIRRILDGGETIGLFRMVGGRVSLLLKRGYFVKTPRGGEPLREMSHLEAVSADDLHPEVRSMHNDLSVGQIETSPDIEIIPLDREVIAGQTETVALLNWIESGAPA